VQWNDLVSYETYGGPDLTVGLEKSCGKWTQGLTMDGHSCEASNGIAILACVCPHPVNALTHTHQLTRLVCPLTCEPLLENIIIYGFLNDIAWTFQAIK